jgi:hypothetical protein
MVVVVTVSCVPLGAVRADSAELRKTVAFVGASLFDGTGKALRSNTTILVRGARIVAVGPVDEIQVPSDARVMHVDSLFIRIAGAVDRWNCPCVAGDAAGLILATHWYFSSFDQ